MLNYQELEEAKDGLWEETVMEALAQSQEERMEFKECRQ
jgi:hypothetical protein